MRRSPVRVRSLAPITPPFSYGNGGFFTLRINASPPLPYSWHSLCLSIWRTARLHPEKICRDSKSPIDFFRQERYNTQAHLRECWNGRQARLRCVWLRRGGSSPLSRTITSVLIGFDILWEHSLFYCSFCAGS